MRGSVILACLVIVVSLVSFGTTVEASATDASPGVAPLRNASGATVGVAKFVETTAGVHIRVVITDLEPGVHGVHIHAVARCDPPGFTAAGGHFNPFGKKHGLLSPEGPHAGDLPPITVRADRTGTLEYLNALITLREGPGSLYDADGSALVIHALPDDQVTDPIGGAGARVACGLIKPAYALVVGGTKAQAGDALLLRVETDAAIPRFPDAYVESVAIFGFAWVDVDTGRVLASTIHPMIGRDSHQNPDSWHTHPATVLAGTVRSAFCVATVGTSQGGMALSGGAMGLAVPASQAGLGVDAIDLVASFEVHPDSGCASGLGVIVLYATEF